MTNILVGVPFASGTMMIVAGLVRLDRARKTGIFDQRGVPYDDRVVGRVLFSVGVFNLLIGLFILFGSVLLSRLR
ncbi:hypothetical protein [Amnibacterium kyonggiense]